ncbi:hypothetical protein [Paractinoplanes brasiliensis]|uniref:hypothetical protein n=1 Tax=Paractinoplanes brasiliensis TaxID=52695 RepID=UPI001A4B92C3|nr:hypothetical protein [Actinoplanes brasiliensis]GID28345.1 hypothetical protein Abr02nite_33280 [Actinoplanes brasiliensis]
MDRPSPVLLLDLDGVLNPFAAPRCPDSYQERVLFDGEEPVRFCAAHGGWIRELAAVGDLWWATGWGENANELYLPLLGVEALPVVQFPLAPFEPEFKVPAVVPQSGSMTITRRRDAAGPPLGAHRRYWWRLIPRSVGLARTSITYWDG